MGDSWLANLLEPVIAERAVASYGRQRPPGAAAERQATFGFLYPDEAEVKTKADVARLGLRAFHFSDVTSAFRTDLLRQVRFPEDIPIFEDIGVAKRLLDAGHALAYAPDAVVVHASEMTIIQLVKRYWQIGSIYERLGIFADLEAATGRSLLGPGLRTAGAVAPDGGTGVMGRRAPVCGGRPEGSRRRRRAPERRARGRRKGGPRTSA